jgi:hypothetical protein
VAWDLKKLLIFLGLLAFLFWWSPWAGLAAIGLLVAWITGLWAADRRRKRALQRRSRAEIEQALAAHGLPADGVFCGDQGIGAFGISQAGRKLVYTAPVSMETTVYESDAAFAAHARRLPQGDFELGITVPGRVTGQPRVETVRVRRRSEAERWVGALEPLLGAKLRSDL